MVVVGAIHPGTIDPHAAARREPAATYSHGMCRSIRTLREPYAERVTEQDVRAAALQYVRKVSGFRAPAGHNVEAFEQAVDAVAAATQSMLDQLQVRTRTR